MKQVTRAVACVVLLVAGAGTPVGLTSQGAKPQPPLAKFEGNVADIVWGGRIESVTGVAPPDLGPANSLLNEKDTWFRTSDVPGPKDIVVSFFKREPALVGSVAVVSVPGALAVADVEIWTSATSAETGFVKVAAGTVPRDDNAYGSPENTFRFTPVEARFVKIRLVRNHANGGDIQLRRIRVIEAQASGYVPLLTRHPEIAAPTFIAEGVAASSGQVASTPGCSPTATPFLPGTGESRKVILLRGNYLGEPGSWVPAAIRAKRLPEKYASSREELGIYDRVETAFLATNHLQPWMLADRDTVVMEQVCDMSMAWLPPHVRQALVAWVAAGHKLIIHDSDKCPHGADYSWLPYRFKTDNPGALGKPGSTFVILENNWMLHGIRGRTGFVDGSAWVRLRVPANELGDSNAITQWGPGWCGQLAVLNANGIFGFAQAYAHYGRGLIIWEGLDVDMTGTTWLDIVRARQLAQGFNTDNLPCSVKVGNFVVTTEPRLFSRGVQAGQAYQYPLSLFSNLKYKGTVTLSTSTNPRVDGLQVKIEPAKVEVTGAHTTEMTVTVPPGALVRPFALEVKGTATDGNTSSLCLQLGPAKNGEISVVSTLSPASKTRRNLEIILDASGSMKTLMGKKSRWDTALDTLEETLAKLPDDFNVGLRIYGHREPSTSPKTCTDSQLVVPIRKLDRAGILKAAKAFRPKGETPLVYSALQAPADLKAVGGGTVILITDGGESCKGDPVKAAADLKASGLDIRLNIVGFAVTDPKVQKDLAGFSQATSGLFYAAQSGAALGDALLVAAIEKYPYTVFDAAGKQVAAGEAGGPADELPAGEYKVVVKAGSKELVAPRVKVTLGQQTTLKIAFKNNQLVLE
jgi:hypothetical protein